MKLGFKSAFFLAVATFVLTSTLLQAQVDMATDTVDVPSVEVLGDREPLTIITHMDEVSSGAIYAGKKSEVIKIPELTLNAATNNPRQTFASVPGINIWESDAVGLQLGVGGRGLSPNRSINFDVRQNGGQIAADPLGYPEAYYTPPLAAVERIEIVRGAGALRYGSQFGGMLNFVLSPGEYDAPLWAHVGVTGGSYGFAAGDLDVGFGTQDVAARAFYQFKRSDGWRQNSDVHVHSAYATVSLRASDRVSLRAEYSLLNSSAHQPGGVTDAQFALDPSVGTRERNWFDLNWNVLSLSMDAMLGESTSLRTQFFGVIAERKSVGSQTSIDKPDVGGSRNVSNATFNTFGNETTITSDVELLGDTTTFVAGLRYFHGAMDQRQGAGTSGSDADFSFINDERIEGSRYDTPSDDAALFLEGVVRLSDAFAIVPGVRVEHISTKADGWYVHSDSSVVDEELSRARTVVLGGLGVSLKFNENIEMYSNATQNFRAINYADMRITSPTFLVDTNLKDESGYTLDLGFRGAVEWCSFDVSGYYLRYSDKLGTVNEINSVDSSSYQFRTNVSDAYTTGIEAVLDLNVSNLIGMSAQTPTIHFVTNVSRTWGEYLASQNTAIEGKQVELVPTHIIRCNLIAMWKGYSMSILSSWVGEQFSDALNTVSTTNAVNGVIPSYTVMDVTIGYQSSWFKVSASCNNLLDTSYFTRRAGGAPGPGIIPSEPLSLFATVQISL